MTAKGLPFFGPDPDIERNTPVENTNHIITRALRGHSGVER